MNGGRRASELAERLKQLHQHAGIQVRPDTINGTPSLAITRTIHHDIPDDLWHGFTTSSVTESMGRDTSEFQAIVEVIQQYLKANDISVTRKFETTSSIQGITNLQLGHSVNARDVVEFLQSGPLAPTSGIQQNFGTTAPAIQFTATQSTTAIEADFWSQWKKYSNGIWAVQLTTGDRMEAQAIRTTLGKLTGIRAFTEADKDSPDILWLYIGQDNNQEFEAAKAQYEQKSANVFGTDSQPTPVDPNGPV